MKEKVLETMKAAGKPMSAGEVEKALQADRKEIDKAFKALKEEGKIEQVFKYTDIYGTKNILKIFE